LRIDYEAAYLPMPLIGKIFNFLDKKMYRSVDGEKMIDDIRYFG